MPALLQPAPPLDAAAVRDTLDRVIASAAFHRTISEQLWSWFLEVLRQVRRALTGEGVASPVAFWGVCVLVVGVALWLGARAADRRERARAAATRRVGAAAVDPWRAADAAAAAGRWEEAAHHLHAAVLAALAACGLVRVHPARTVGDYARELRRRAGGGSAGGDARAAAVREAARAAARAYEPFARGYEAVVYGPRGVERAAYEALRRAASPLLAGGGDGRPAMPENAA